MRTWRTPASRLWVVNAHFIKHVPGRKTDMSDSQWLAVLARFGLVRASFIPPKDLRELRLVSRYRRKLTQMHSAELNRLHKVLDDAGIKLGGVVSDINGVSATAMVKGLIEGQGIASLLGLARGALKLKRDDLQAALDGDLSATPPVRAQAHPRPHRIAAARVGRHRRLPAGGHAALRIGARPAADHSRHRPDRRCADPHRDRRRHGSASAAPSGWPRGLRCARATTSRRANASRAGLVTATASSGTSCASAPTRRAGPRAPWRPSTAA